ncbi:MAG TPA: ABC transporter permease [Puia sp.]|nr:ABC transporter permease [Puia sp.]
MFQNYLKIAYRNLLKNKAFSLINILGLSIGISAAMVIFLIVQYDLTFDKFENDNPRIYRVVADYVFSGSPFHSSAIPDAMPVAVKDQITGIEQVVPFRIWKEDVKASVPAYLNNSPAVFKKQGHIIFADENYFKLLPYKWLQGSPQSSFQNPYQTVLTESSLKVYFPDLTPQQAIGKELIFYDSIYTKITGIVQDLPYNTDLTFSSFISRATIQTPRLKPNDGDEWGSASPSSQLFLKLSPNANQVAIQEAITKLYRSHQSNNTGETTRFHLQPLADLHFNADYENYNGRVANRSTLYGLLAIAAFLLFLGCINFINLNTAKASQRAKEIGVRKVIGSSKKQLVYQFLSESLLLTLVASIFSILLTPFILRVFADFIPAGLHFNLVQQSGMLLFLLALIVIVGIGAGLYPAFILSSYQPVSVLKGNVHTKTGKPSSSLLRKSFIISQFVIAQVFIIGTIVVAKQIHYSLTQDLGFKKNAVVTLQASWNAPLANKDLLLNKLQSIPGITMISLSNNPPTSIADRGDNIKYTGDNKETQTHAQVKLADTNYIKLYQIALVAGTNIPSSKTIKAALINQTCARALGFQDPAQAVGQDIEFNHQKVQVAGVIHDFHQKSFHQPITSLIISSKESDQLLFNILLQSQSGVGPSWKNTLSAIETAYKEVYPGEDFEYHFLDDNIAEYYLTEQHLSQLLSWATALTIFISCLGLFALAVYSALQRTKEIGVRKIIGASILQILSLLIKDFLQPVLVAFIIAIPIAWWAANNWLQNFAYKTGLSWWIFVLTGLATLIVALITISFQSIKAALANPAKSLRTE